jgi:hypothetical protein
MPASRSRGFATADRRYFDKARHLGQIAWLPDFSVG